MKMVLKYLLLQIITQVSNRTSRFYTRNSVLCIFAMSYLHQRLSRSHLNQVTVKETWWDHLRKCFFLISVFLETLILCYNLYNRISFHIKRVSFVRDCGFLLLFFVCFQNNSPLQKQSKTQETFNLLLLVKVHEYFLLTEVECDLLNGRELHHPWEQTPSPQANISLVLFQCSANKEHVHTSTEKQIKKEKAHIFS